MSNNKKYIGSTLILNSQNFRDTMDSSKADIKIDIQVIVDGEAINMTLIEFVDAIKNVPQTLIGKITRRIDNCEDDSDLMTLDTVITYHLNSKNITGTEAKVLYQYIETKAHIIALQNAY